MKTVIRFHCNECGNSDLEFHALVTHDAEHERFKILKVAQRFAFCKTCQQDRPLIQSQEVAFGDREEPAPQSDFDPLKQRGDL